MMPSALCHTQAAVARRVLLPRLCAHRSRAGPTLTYASYSTSSTDNEGSVAERGVLVTGDRDDKSVAPAPAPAPQMSLAERERNTLGTLGLSKADLDIAPVFGPPGSIQRVHTGAVLLELDMAFREDPHMDAVNKLAYRHAKNGGLKLGAVEYINHALKLMDDHEVKPDLFTYNQLLDVLPKHGKLKNKRFMDVLMPPQTPHHDCALELLTRMEERAMIPDLRTFKILEAVFGRASQPLVKCEALAWWFLRIQSDNPYILPDQLPESPLDQAVLALNHLGVETKGLYRRLSVIARLPRSMKTKKLWEELHEDEMEMRKFQTTVYRSGDDGEEDSCASDDVTASEDQAGASQGANVIADPGTALAGFIVGMQTNKQVEEMEYYTTVHGSAVRCYDKKFTPTMVYLDSVRDYGTEQRKQAYADSGMANFADEKTFDLNERTTLHVRGPHLNWFCRRLVPIYTLVEDLVDEPPVGGHGTKERLLATCVINTQETQSRESLLEEWIRKLGVTATDVVLDLGPELTQPVTPSLLQCSNYERTEAKRNAAFLQAAVMPVAPPRRHASIGDRGSGGERRAAEAPGRE